MILNQIVEKRKQQLLKEQSAIGFEEMKALAMQDSRTCISLYDALKQDTLSVISEVKKHLLQKDSFVKILSLYPLPYNIKSGNQCNFRIDRGTLFSGQQSIFNCNSSANCFYSYLKKRLYHRTVSDIRGKMYWGRCNTAHRCHFRHRNLSAISFYRSRFRVGMLGRGSQSRRAFNRVLEVDFKL